ncbi:uncharacterized protein LOC110461206 [Mizuhopecten yessoensis]|uniref:uncharacterized protein LOC110461206 n=1 Tax=Mizuhopecten yessoensis TaxID=6573 RepID=UPI000B458C07|nr:uncharacterized protein LOC110461206 [Mizuhopecten yessoensis]XP_021370253.1 uncharacterized protein LOC110461206 [Mizuhopecten yessoensis]
MSLRNTFLVILLYAVIDYTSADAIQLLMVNNVSCSMINEVDQFDSYQLNWDGEMLPPNCKLGFTGKSILVSEAHAKYRVCVKTVLYDIKDCNFKMNFYCNDKIDPAQEYTCGTVHPPTFCAPDHLFIAFSRSSLASSTSSFQLIVTAEKTYTAPEENIYLVYSVVAGLSLLCVLILCTIILVVCKKHKQVRQARTGNTPGLYDNAPPSMMHGAAFPIGMHNQGYFNTEQDFHPRAVAVSLPAYSEKEEKNEPPAYTEVTDIGTKA